MAIPVFWNTPFSYTELAGVTDVSTIIAGVHAAVTALGWTDESGLGTGPWKTPARADGIFFRIALARISATRLGWTMYDQAGLNVSINVSNYLQDIDAGGTPVQIYAGTLHLCVNTQRASQETFWCCVLDQTPDPMSYPRALYIHYTGPRTADGTLRNYQWSSVNMMEPGGTTYGTRGTLAITRANSGTYFRRTMSGTALFSPAEYGSYNNQNGLLYGRIPMAIAIDKTGLNYGSEVTVPIDAGVNAVFKIVACMDMYNQYLAFRKS
jgi:hypothetical protein